MAIFLVLIMPLSGGLSILRTQRLGMHLLRGACVVFANTFFFMGLATMPLADAVAIFFVSPLLITIFSVIFLKEKVGPRRWTATLIGLIGVIIIVRPGTSAFQIASILPVFAAIGYAFCTSLHGALGAQKVLRHDLYIQLTFILVSASVGLTVGDGRFDTGDSAMLSFLRTWVVPEVSHVGFWHFWRDKHLWRLLHLTCLSSK